MNNDLSNSKIRLFYNDLQINLNDTRSNSGRKHELLLVITLLVISILRSYGHLNMSKIHRNMVRNYDESMCVFAEGY
ncbi:hypothetical protein K5X82_13615 [Halosquirtibacter xylanolyticus]|uniref:hypothetical protein n=1 Tax=Halosquirtibacter xylanolyticus TaxID=3374599 RepID=UPI003748EF0F|nr:hypothetical protein K5X82_13615 [Prolixibacteraceae bacterium]